MLRKLLLAVVVACPAIVWGTTSTYTFDNLNNGTLAGQDNWMVLSGSGDSSDVVQAGTGSDITKVMANPVSAGPTGVHRMGRTNDGNFSFGSLAGATGLTLSFDTQVYNNSADVLDFINFALADANNAHSGPALAFKQENGGTPQWAFGSSAQSTGGNLPATPTNDWIRLSLVMDFTANSGQGTGMFIYQDLTTGGAQQTMASGLNLGNPGAIDSFWNTMWSRSDNGANAADSHVVLDNLTITPTFAAVPEINGAWAAAAAALVLIARFVRKRQPTNA